MSAGWSELFNEVATWHAAGKIVEFWWRDDDASRGTAALKRLLKLAGDSGAPLALAVIPQAADPEAFDPLFDNVMVLQHGVDHVNRAAPGQKKTEFPESDSVALTMKRLLTGRLQLQRMFGHQALPVLVPPWNRFPNQWTSRLAAHGYSGLSKFALRANAQPAPGLIQVNAHVDIIEWRHGRGFVGEQQALALACEQLQLRRRGAAEATEPVGWLTHHALHDEAAWRFLADLFERTRKLAGLHWLHPDQIFHPTAP